MCSDCACGGHSVGEYPVTYNPTWTDGDRVAVGDYVRLAYLRELTEAVNRSEVPGGGGFTDPFLTGERKFIRTKHIN